VRTAGLFLVVLLGALLTAPGVASGDQRRTPQVSTVQLRDVVRLAGVPLACVAKQQDGERAFFCRRTDAARGTYGVIITRTRLLAVRFESHSVARIVFTARNGSPHGRACGGT
jgi:hypothetical protein